MRRRRFAVAVAVESLEGRALCDGADGQAVVPPDHAVAVVDTSMSNRVDDGDIDPPLDEDIVPNNNNPWDGESSSVGAWIDPFR